MKKFSVPDEAAPTIEALRGLIAPGVSAAPVENSLLIDHPAVIAKTGPHAPAATRAQVFIDVLEHVVGRRLKGKDKKTAELLFALGDWVGVSALDRHNEVAKLHGSRWENYRRGPLLQHLMATYLALFREGEEASVAATPVEGANSVAEEGSRPRSTITGGDYVVESYEASYNLPRGPGLPREILQIRQIIATKDGVDAWRQSYRYWGKGVDELPDMTLFGPGQLSITYDGAFPHATQTARIYITEVKFPRPLRKDQRARFAIFKRHQVEFEELVRDGWQDSCGLTALTVPVRTATVSVHFPDNKRPRAVWHYEDIPDWLLPGVATETNLLTVDESGFAIFSWNGLFVGHCYGLAWEW